MSVPAVLDPLEDVNLLWPHRDGLIWLHRGRLAGRFVTVRVGPTCRHAGFRDGLNSIAIASNQPFSGWTRTFTDPRLCAAIIDRLTFAGNILETGATSYRLAHARSATAH
jgi:hypothetical protein